jgi:glutaredoxin
MRLRLYSRPGCHLCEEMKATIARAAQAAGADVAIDEVDISTDAALEARYGLEIPVLEVDGRKVAKYRITAEAARRIVDAGTA